MMHFNGQNDVYGLQTLAARDGVVFHLAYIGRDFTVEHRRDFDPVYMKALVEYGREQMRSSTAWLDSTPIFSQPQSTR